jgi:hypothetical protein
MVCCKSPTKVMGITFYVAVIDLLVTIINENLKITSKKLEGNRQSARLFIKAHHDSLLLRQNDKQQQRLLKVINVVQIN